MKIIKLKAFQGPNVYSYHPVLWVQVDLESNLNTPSNQIAGFNDGLLKVLPTLMEHQCALGCYGGFVKRLEEGTYLAHIFEHVLLELQRRCGDDVAYGKARMTDVESVYDVIAAFRDESTARRCAVLTADFLNALIKQQPFDFVTQLKTIQDYREKRRLGPSAQAIFDAAQKRGIPVERVPGEDLLLLGQGIHMRKVWSTVTERTSLLATDFVANKHLTTSYLAQIAVPVPQSEIVSTEAEAVEAFRRIGKTVAVKPLSGSHGRGVTVEVASEAEVSRAFQIAANYGAYVLVEEYIAGKQYRLCVVNGKMVAAAERIPAYVIGDGVHTVLELVDIVNQNPLRGDGHDKPLSKILLDDLAVSVLSKQKLSPHRVPEAKRIVQIRTAANLSTGGTAVDVTQMVHADTVQMAGRVAEAVGLDVAGLDIIAKDITKPLANGNGAVIEVNAAPGIRMHHHPSAGKARDVGGEIVDYLFPYGRQGKIPVAAVTGTNGKTTVSRMLSAIYQQTGLCVAMANTEGVFINQECILKGDCSGPQSAQMALRHQKAQAAILETARGGIVRAGLGFTSCDAAVLTNISEDHLGQDGIDSLEDLAYIKSLVLEMVEKNGAAIINADDAFARYLAGRVRANVVYFSMQEDNPLVKRHLALGGLALFLKEGVVYKAKGFDVQELFDPQQVPVTMRGKVRHNVQNALAAAAAAVGLGIDDVHIRRALYQFAYNAGRMTMIRLRDFCVCIDYGHNIAGYEATIAAAHSLVGNGRLIGVIAAPGDRRDEAILRLGAVAGMGFDEIYIKEDEDLRGRKSGEVAALLKRGALSAGVPESRLRVVLDERQAVELAVNHAGSGDFIVIFYEKYDAVVRVLQRLVERDELKPQPITMDFPLWVRSFSNMQGGYIAEGDTRQ